jgi:hypothetical protein
MNDKTQAEAVLKMLESREFAKWYRSGSFHKYITGNFGYGEPIVSDDILNDINGFLRKNESSPVPINECDEEIE